MESISGDWDGFNERPTGAPGAIDEAQPLPPEDLRACTGPNLLIDQLYRAHGPALVKKLSREAVSRDEAQDMVQEIFTRLTRLGGPLLQVERPLAYLNRIASNLAKDRSKNFWLRSVDRLDDREDGRFAPDPVRHLESRDMLNRIEAAMLRLKPRTREIFMAHRVEALSYAEIAERMGMSTKGVEKQMSKALRQLDKMLNR